MKFYSGQIAKLQRASEKAISKFLSTERKLSQQNEKLDALIVDVDKEISELQSIKLSAVSRKVENTGIISRIGQIIRGGDEN